MMYVIYLYESLIISYNSARMKRLGEHEWAAASAFFSRVVGSTGPREEQLKPLLLCVAASSRHVIGRCYWGR